MNEVWRSVAGYEGYYEVSDQGRVRSLDRHVDVVRCGRVQTMHKLGKILTPVPNKDGYLCLLLWKDGKGRSFKVARLVALAFIPNPEDKPEVNHLDVKTCNLPSKLEWATGKENCLHRSRILGKKGYRRPVVGEDKESIRYFSSAIEAERNAGYKASGINNAILKRGQNQHRGFTWRYATSEEQQFYERFAA